MAETEIALPLTEAGLGHLLGMLASRPGPVPKFLYPSAGTLYPVQAYVILRQPLGALAPGAYYHDPDDHALVRLSDLAPDGSAPATLLVLVAQYAAIEPIYGPETERFCLLEAGYMAELLHQAQVSLREVDNPADLMATCRLDASHVPLVCWAIGEDG